jgi:N6-adenosine-specific RNA methylase IME4
MPQPERTVTFTNKHASPGQKPLQAFRFRLSKINRYHKVTNKTNKIYLTTIHALMLNKG